ncbi:acetyl-CoA synthetase [Salix suchowensis]|nr:acetyl-CoA synthetase [Salix suchowensis]
MAMSVLSSAGIIVVGTVSLTFPNATADKGANPDFTVDELAYQLEATKATFMFVYSDAQAVGTAVAAARRVNIPLRRVVLFGTASELSPKSATVDELARQGLLSRETFLERRLAPGEGKTKLAFLSFIVLGMDKVSAVSLLQKTAWIHPHRQVARVKNQLPVLIVGKFTTYFREVEALQVVAGRSLQYESIENLSYVYNGQCISLVLSQLVCDDQHTSGQSVSRPAAFHCQLPILIAAPTSTLRSEIMSRPLNQCVVLHIVSHGLTLPPFRRSAKKIAVKMESDTAPTLDDVDAKVAQHSPKKKAVIKKDGEPAVGSKPSIQKAPAVSASDPSKIIPVKLAFGTSDDKDDQKPPTWVPKIKVASDHPAVKTEEIDPQSHAMAPTNTPTTPTPTSKAKGKAKASLRHVDLLGISHLGRPRHCYHHHLVSLNAMTRSRILVPMAERLLLSIQLLLEHRPLGSGGAHH